MKGLTWQLILLALGVRTSRVGEIRGQNATLDDLDFKTDGIETKTETDDFNEMDMDHDGVISRAEFAAYESRKKGKELTTRKAGRVEAEIGADGRAVRQVLLDLEQEEAQEQAAIIHVGKSGSSQMNHAYAMPVYFDACENLDAKGAKHSAHYYARESKKTIGGGDGPPTMLVFNGDMDVQAVENARRQMGAGPNDDLYLFMTEYEGRDAYTEVVVIDPDFFVDGGRVTFTVIGGTAGNAGKGTQVQIVGNFGRGSFVGLDKVPVPGYTPFGGIFTNGEKTEVFLAFGHGKSSIGVRNKDETVDDLIGAWEKASLPKFFNNEMTKKESARYQGQMKAIKDAVGPDDAVAMCQGVAGVNAVVLEALEQWMKQA